MRLLVPPMVLFALACAGESPSPRAPEPERAGAREVGPSTDRRGKCLNAQEREVEVWLRDMVETPGDELETWATLGMILTITEPEVLEEIRFASPEAGDAADRSEDTWRACRGLLEINCASLLRAIELTEARLEAGLFERDGVQDRCERGEVTSDQADCALAAKDAEVARGCF